MLESLVPLVPWVISGAAGVACLYYSRRWARETSSFRNARMFYTAQAALYQQLSSQMMMAGQGNPTVQAALSDPGAYELKMVCDACEQEWYPQSTAEVAPCPQCEGTVLHGSI